MTAPPTPSLEQWPRSRLKPYARNARTHPSDQIEKLAASIQEYGFTVPLLVSKDGEIIAGHGRALAAEFLGLETVPVLVADHMTEDQRQAYRIADNRLAELSDWSDATLSAELKELSAKAVSMKGLGFDAKALIAKIQAPAGQADVVQATPGSLLEDHLEPPFSILQVTSGRWQARKRAWLERLPLDHEAQGRERMLVMTASRTDPALYSIKRQVENRIGRELSFEEFMRDHYEVDRGKRTLNGTSQFDPVLAELMTIWYCPPGGTIYDPFAGDVERGLVAAAKGRKYIGVEIRAEQVAANTAAAKRLGAAPMPKWHHADARTFTTKRRADLAFTCPPYWQLEKYSDDPKDLSNMSLEDFTLAHSEAISRAAAILKDDRFAVWVIGDCRDNLGRYARLPDTTIDLFEGHGLHLHSENILATPVGSRSMTARKMFGAKRTIASRHEYVLVFCKGDPKKAAQALGPVAVGEGPDEQP